MSRRDHGPKRRAEAYAYRIWRDKTDKDGNLVEKLTKLLSAAYMAGYGSAARARRKPKPEVK